MKAVILAGGLDTTLRADEQLRPKTMAEIGGKPVLWHVMKIYACHGVTEFILALGARAEVVKRYLLNFHALNSDLSIDLSNGQVTIHSGSHADWTVHLVDTGPLTQTGGRLKRLEKWLGDDETFFFSHGDGVTDLNLSQLLHFHQSHGKLATVATVHSPERFGRLHFEDKLVTKFIEKPETSEGWINSGYFVLNRQALNYIEGDEDNWERGPVVRLTQDKQLMGYRHSGFWSNMDTLKAQTMLEERWASDQAPWKVWS